jgi:hypothetical protein
MGQAGGRREAAADAANLAAAVLAINAKTSGWRWPAPPLRVDLAPLAARRPDTCWPPGRPNRPAERRTPPSRRPGTALCRRAADPSPPERIRVMEGEPRGRDLAVVTAAIGGRSVTQTAAVPSPGGRRELLRTRTRLAARHAPLEAGPRAAVRTADPSEACEHEAARRRTGGAFAHVAIHVATTPPPRPAAPVRPRPPPGFHEGATRHVRP